MTTATAAAGIEPPLAWCLPSCSRHTKLYVAVSDREPMETSSSGVATPVLCHALVRCRSLPHEPMTRDTCHATRPSATKQTLLRRLRVLFVLSLIVHVLIYKRRCRAMDANLTRTAVSVCLVSCVLGSGAFFETQIGEGGLGSRY